jgi:hypothetical protein
MMKKLQEFVSRFWYKITFYAIGLGSIIWILIRVIPKPSRIYYPCMRATTPLAASFITYITSLTALTYFLKKARTQFIQSRYLIACSLLVAAFVAGILTMTHTNFSAKANTFALQPPQTGNAPIGIAKGIYPGRVVWVYNPDATNESCSDEEDDYWWSDYNTDLNVVKNMLSSGLKNMTGATTDQISWDSIFHYYNRTHGRGNVGYSAGEKIVIKVNMNGGDLNGNVNTSPQLCYAILDQLVNKAGVSQANIFMGDPLSGFTTVSRDECQNAFPNVNFWDNTPTASANIVFAADSSFVDAIPQDYVTATYMINIPVLKKHHRAGISMCSKNHFGSLGAYTGGAWHLHPSLPCPEADAAVTNGEYHQYRCFVDIMGHKDLGGKTILFLVDGLWGSTNYGHPPIKWRMSPFNSDWPNSLFLSQDPVAIESVGYDFLYNEFDENHPTEGTAAMTADPMNKGPFPRFPGADDFLHQAADPTNWPAGIQYDPEGDGTILTSLGTHEHWNNATSKKYSRNLGNGNGIELYSVGPVNALKPITDVPQGNAYISNYPNPFKEFTTIKFNLAKSGQVQIKIFDMSGKIVRTINYGQANAGVNECKIYSTDKGNTSLQVGSYICSIEVNTNTDKFRMSNKIIVSE